MMRYLELFAGAGGLSMGLEAAGMQCAGHAEIDPHARAVLRKHWPDTPLFGDVRAVTGDMIGPCDLVSFGAPCQDLSMAGKRAGLQGSRSVLFYEGVRLWHETNATYALYENVDGARSSNKGADFAAVLSAFVGAAVAVPERWASSGVAAGPTGVAAWRVLDLQHFGPPQRRRRVFVLAARAGGCDPAEILAVSESVCGHSAPRERTREGFARGAAGGVGGGDVAFAVRGRETGAVAEASDIAPSLRTPGGGSSHAHVLAFHHTQDPISGSVSPSIGRTTDGMGVLCTTGPVTHALTSEGCDASEDGTGRGTSIVVNDPNDRTDGAIVASYFKGLGHNKDDLFVVGPAPVSAEEAAAENVRALREGVDAKAVRETIGRPECIHAAEVLRPAVYGGGIRRKAGQSDTSIVGTVSREEDRAGGAVRAVRESGREGRTSQGPRSVEQRAGEPGAHLPELSSSRALAGAPFGVGRPRRLTPIECERLQSWPDHHTAHGVKEDGSEYALSDTARYRLAGNGVGSVVAAWIARRLVWAEAATAVERAA